MPEGDTIWRTARTLGGVLSGQTVTGFSSSRPEITAAARRYDDRSGQPCLRCGTLVQRRVQGEQARSTYWCRRCQPSASPDYSRILRE